MVVVASKIDTMQESSRADRLRAMCEERELPFFVISAVTGAGVDELKYYLGSHVKESRQAAAEEVTETT